MEALEARDVADAAGTLYPGNAVALFVAHTGTNESGLLRFLVRQRSDTGEWELPNGPVLHGDHNGDVVGRVMREDHTVEIDTVGGLQQLMPVPEIIGNGVVVISHWLIHPFAVHRRIESAKYDTSRFTAIDWVAAYTIGSLNVTGRTRLVLNRLPQIRTHA